MLRPKNGVASIVEATNGDAIGAMPARVRPTKLRPKW